MNKIVYNGWIEVICGPMFSGKTDELLKKLDKIKYSKKNYIVFKPASDKRSSKEILSRRNNSTIAVEISKPQDIIDYLNSSPEKYKVIAIDEVQFLDKDIVNVCSYLAKNKYHIVLAGLDKNYLGKPFGHIADLLAIADNVYKLYASCTICGSVATFSQRLVDSDSDVLIGDKEYYEARCYEHFSTNKK